MAGRTAEFAVLGPWSLETSRQFWEGFTPAALAGEPAGPRLRTVFCAEGDWRRAEAEVTQSGDTARVVLPATVILMPPPRRCACSWRWTSMGVAGRRWAAGTR
jgi:DNA-3-methyladenine glycosylase II